MKQELQDAPGPRWPGFVLVALLAASIACTLIPKATEPDETPKVEKLAPSPGPASAEFDAAYFDVVEVWKVGQIEVRSYRYNWADGWDCDYQGGVQVYSAEGKVLFAHKDISLIEEGKAIEVEGRVILDFAKYTGGNHSCAWGGNLLLQVYPTVQVIKNFECECDFCGGGIKQADKDSNLEMSTSRAISNFTECGPEVSCGLMYEEYQGGWILDMENSLEAGKTDQELQLDAEYLRSTITTDFLKNREEAWNRPDMEGHALESCELAEEMIELVCSGHGDQAAKLLDSSWPAEVTGKERYAIEFYSGVRNLEFWPDIAKLNGWDANNRDSPPR